MTNREKYIEAFQTAFETETDVEEFQFKVTEEWDSIGHMILVTTLEETFEITLEPEEIVALSSFENGIEILKKKGIEI